MSRKGDCWDNAVAESFFKIIKSELIYHNTYNTREEARRDIFEYIETFYNSKRLHSKLEYMFPIQFEQAAIGFMEMEMCMLKRGRSKLMNPQFVKPYVKSNKNDCNDA